MNPRNQEQDVPIHGYEELDEYIRLHGGSVPGRYCFTDVYGDGEHAAETDTLGVYTVTVQEGQPMYEFHATDPDDNPQSKIIDESEFATGSVKVIVLEAR